MIATTLIQKKHACSAWFCAAITIFITQLLLAAPLDPNSYPAPGHYVLVNGTRLHLHCTGSGSPVVVFDAGLGGTSLDWSKVQPRVAHFTRVCSYDRAGYGWSDSGVFPRTSRVIVKELEQLLNISKLAAPYVLVGHSFGGLNVKLFAYQFPERIAGLVLIDATHEKQFQRFAEAQIKKPIVPPLGREFVISNHYEVPNGLPEVLKETAQALVLMPDAIRTLYSELKFMQISAQQVGAVADTLPDVPMIVISHDSRKQAKSARAQRMANTWMELQQSLAQQMPQGQMIIATESGHYVQLDQPQLVADAIVDVVMNVRQHLSVR